MWSLLLSLLLVAQARASYPGNYALEFDGVDDYLSIQHTYRDDTLDDFWTVEAWINPQPTQTFWQLNIVGFPGRHPNLEYCGQDNSQCKPGAPLTQLREKDGKYFTIVGDATKIAPNQWHHIAGTWDNKTLYLYVDGQLDAIRTPYQEGYVEAGPCQGYDCDSGLQIGGFHLRTPEGYFSNQYFGGLIDEVRVWKVGRTQAEIISTMSTTVTGGEYGLLYYWRFDEGKGAVTKSMANDAYGLLGGGRLQAEPQFRASSAPITNAGGGGDNIQVIIEKESAGAVLAGALLALFFMGGGISIGALIGWKVHERRAMNKFTFPWEESKDLLGGDRGRGELDRGGLDRHGEEDDEDHDHVIDRRSAKGGKGAEGGGLLA